MNENSKGSAESVGAETEFVPTPVADVLRQWVETHYRLRKQMRAHVRDEFDKLCADSHALYSAAAPNLAAMTNSAGSNAPTAVDVAPVRDVLAVRLLHFADYSDYDDLSDALVDDLRKALRDGAAALERAEQDARRLRECV